MRKRMIGMVILLVGMLLCSACSISRPGGLTARRIKKSSAPSVASNTAKQQNQEEAQSTADLSLADETVYLIVGHDVQNYQITLMDVSNSSQICYEYTDGTEFFDKYGNDTPRTDFSEGKLVIVKRRNSNDTLGAIAFTDDTWSYENVRNYSIDEIKNRMDIADTSYQCDPFMKVFSDGAEISISSVGESDILNVYGIGRTIYAIVVETGHGTLELTNTELFEGGWVNLGTKVYAKVTENMTMELPEGIYEFEVANDGYGDSGEVLIRRDKTTTIDLNDFKGEGPKLCKLTFHVGVDGAILTLNGKKIDYSKPMELRYGVYSLGVLAEGYDAWTKQLVINSPKAKVDILLTEDTGAKTASNAQTDSDDDSEESDGSRSDTNSSGKGSSSSDGSTQLAGSRAGTKAGSRTGSKGSNSSDSSSGSSRNSVNSALANAALGSSLASIITGGDSTDYLDTLSDLVDSLDKLNKSSSNNTD